MITLTSSQRERLRPYENTLEKVFFHAGKTHFVDYHTTRELGNIYREITGNEDCTSCAGKTFIKRLSAWYCGNKDGILPKEDLIVKARSAARKKTEKKYIPLKNQTNDQRRIQLPEQIHQ